MVANEEEIDIRFCGQCESSLVLGSMWCRACGHPVPLSRHRFVNAPERSRGGGGQAPQPNWLQPVLWTAMFAVLILVPAIYLATRSTEPGITETTSNRNNEQASAENDHLQAPTARLFLKNDAALFELFDALDPFVELDSVEELLS